jgi:hypothetical protein
MKRRIDPNEIRAAIQFFAKALVGASKGYSPTVPDQARAAVRIALVGTIKLISALYPDEPSLPLPLNQLLYDLDDLDHGRVAAFFQPTKVSHRPRTALSEDLFRAIVAAAMTLLMDGTKVSRDEAARDIARRLTKMGCKHTSGKSITGRQIAKWREKMMTERAAESRGVARYQHTLQLVSGKPPLEAVAFILDWLTDLSPANFPEKPPA